MLSTPILQASWICCTFQCLAYFLVPRFKSFLCKKWCLRFFSGSSALNCLIDCFFVCHCLIRQIILQNFSCGISIFKTFRCIECHRIIILKHAAQTVICLTVNTQVVFPYYFFQCFDAVGLLSYRKINGFTYETQVVFLYCKPFQKLTCRIFMLFI